MRMPAILAVALALSLAPAVRTPAVLAQESADEPSLVGKDAPEIETKEWFNSDGRTRVADYRGEVLLVECFATWCGPCRGQMPHLTHLMEEYGKKGFNVLSITQEPRDTVLKFMAQLNIADIGYTMGCGGGTSAYPAPGIPKGFLIGVDGKVIWNGHPGSLPAGLLEEELKKVKVDDAAREAKGEKGLAYAEELFGDRQYLRGVAVLERIGRSCKGTGAAKKAEDRKAALEKDADAKRELAAQKVLDRLVGGLEMPKEKLKDKERTSRAAQLESLAKKYEGSAPATAGQATAWAKVLREDWKSEH